MENKKSKILDSLKNSFFIIKLIFWTSISILSFGVALLFLPVDKEEYYEDEYYLKMRIGGYIEKKR